MRQKHSAPTSVKPANLGRWFPRMCCYSVKTVSSWCITTRYLAGVRDPLRGKSMAKLRSFTVRAGAEAKWEEGRRPIRKAPMPATLDTPCGIRSRDLDDESPHCKSHHSASPIVPEVSSSVTPSVGVSSVTLYSGTAPSDAPGTDAPSDAPGTDAPPSTHLLLYGGRPPLVPVLLRLPRFADKDFIPSTIQSILVATMPYPNLRSRAHPPPV